MEIRFLKNEELCEVEALSKQFSEEGICSKIIPDNVEYYSIKKVVGAFVDGRLVGYCFGCFDSETKTRSYASEGDTYFELEEIYVAKDYREQKIGRMMYAFIEGYARVYGAKTIRLNAVSKDYEKLLNFYIKILKMDFISAYLVKQI